MTYRTRNGPASLARACARRRPARMSLRQSWILLSDDPPAFDSDLDDMPETPVTAVASPSR